ncbi:uncharacterized protein DUF3224 [Neolewinella xylanilytica]|uniref:Uncharacterized protein DUF3224 n=1 Tax=Neolewinella xylanilytica TaxID=1514080 RepID=A0A2S6IB67_9BACT|nr:DUF3224 domain-containing protein [Neolewinella xylanilytica]PPK88738.1 uncharacterized protein DUF3224 [Neolewinella xylanilytica]
MPTMKVTGTFTVKMSPLEPYADSGKAGPTLGRMSLDKTFTGPLTGSSQGEMLTGMTATQGSAGYVAMEKVTGSLDGKSGSFILQHFGVMHAGDSRLILEVVPASGTDELLGLRGTMYIRQEDGKHFYDLAYQL